MFVLTDEFFLVQILPLFRKHKVIHFNRTDTRLANNGLPLAHQWLRCRVNFQGLKFTPQLEALGAKLVRILQQRGPFVVLHLRYEMDMLAFSGCTHGCTEEEAEELKKMRFLFKKSVLNWCSGYRFLASLIHGSMLCSLGTHIPGGKRRR